MKEKIYVGILEDHLPVINGYKFSFQQSPYNIEVSWSAMFFDEVESNLERFPTDVLIFDAGVNISAEDKNLYPIFQAIPQLLDKKPDMEILVISMYDRPAFIRNIKQSGASGYILKSESEILEHLPEAVVQISEGGIYFSPKSLEALSDIAMEGGELTQRQIEVLSVCASYPDLTTTDIARKLNIAKSTLRNSLSDIYFRLGVKRMPAAIEKGRKLGLITPAI
ncbi:MAG: response regulator transcription factor [Anaerolineae bacterium]|nr:response regulator transcription factor [Anaerolineae bacterium]